MNSSVGGPNFEIRPTKHESLMKKEKERKANFKARQLGQGKFHANEITSDIPESKFRMFIVFVKDSITDDL